MGMHGLRVAVASTMVFIASATTVSAASAADLTLLCAGAMKAPVAALLARRDARLPRVVATYATSGAIRDRLAKGERPDLVISSSEQVFFLMKQKLIDVSTRRALGETEIGVAVRGGAPVPDIATADALKATLLAARKVVIVDPTQRSSGALAIGLFKELHIDEAMQPKLLELDGGNVLEAVAKGKADLGLQQISEILPVAGVKLVGPLPGDLKRLTRYDVAMLVSTTHRAEAVALVTELSSPAAHGVIEKSGFGPAR